MVQEVSASARSMRKKRALLKTDDVAWDAHRQEEAERHRNRRKKRSEEQILRDRETGAARSRRHYASQKAKGTLRKQTNSVKILTRRERKVVKDYNKEKQRIHRQKKTPQQKVWDKKKDRDRKREKRAKLNKSSCSTPAATESNPSQRTGFVKPASRRSALSRLWGKMPKDAEKFAEIVSGLLDSKRLTPRKMKALNERGLRGADRPVVTRRLFRDATWEVMKGNIARLKNLRDDKSRAKRSTIVASLLVKKYRHQRRLAREIGVRPQYLGNVTKRSESNVAATTRYRKQRSDMTCIDVVNSIHASYRDPAVSRELPLMRSVKKDLVPRRVMEVSVTRAYEIWKAETPDLDNVCSLSVFMKLRPDDVLLQCRHTVSQCLCEYCTDIMLKLQTLNRIAAMCGRKDLGFKDKYALIAATVCPPDDGCRYAKPTCTHRTCKDCGVGQLREKLNPLIEAHTGGTVTWRKWESTTYHHDQTVKTKKVLKTKTGTLEELVLELVQEVAFLAQHLFVANWQQDMFNMAKQLPCSSTDTVVMVLDFAENYGCFHQDEIQSAHWAVNQVTVHPVVVYYSCPDCPVRHVVQEAVVIISEDLKHDGHAVQHFVNETMLHLRNNRGVTVNQVVEFTDGCAGQYKSKLPFSDISFSAEDIGVKRECHYFGSRHGKGPSDGVSGVVKSAVRRAVVSRRAVVDTAVSMFTYLQENMTKNDCKCQRRVFIYVAAGDIDRDRPSRTVKTALPGTRSLQAVKSVQPGVVGVRLLSCFCPGCQGDEPCNNSNVTHPWQKRVLKMCEPPPSPVHEVHDHVTVVPTDGTVVPMDGTVVPMDGTVVPMDGTVVPTDGTVVPMDGTVVEGSPDQAKLQAALQDIWQSFTRGGEY